MRETKVQGAAKLLIRNPDISNQELAKAFGVRNTGAWGLRNAAEKYIKTHKLKASIPMAEESPRKKTTESSHSEGAHMLPVTMIVVGEDLVVRIPKKTVAALLFPDLTKLLN